MLDVPVDLPYVPDQVEEYIISNKSFDTVNANIATIIKIPEKESINRDKPSYYDLYCTNDDRNKINELITTMGSHGKIKLLLKYKKHLEKIGDEITHVHPLKFLGVIYSNPSLKQYMNIVLDDFFKSYNFINGLGSAMEDQLKNSNVYLYLDDFCRDVNADKETVRNYIDKKNWKKLLLFLCKN